MATSKRIVKKKSKRKGTKRPARARKQDGGGEGGFDSKMMKAWQKSMTPGRGHARLEPMIGTFSAVLKIWMAPGAPPQEGSGTSRNKWVLGGRYVEQKYRGRSMGKPFQGIGYNGYDNGLKKYVGTWMDSMGTSIMFSEGTGKATAKRMEFESIVVDPFSGKKMKQRALFRIKDDKKHWFEMFSKLPGGREFLSLQIEYTRK